MKALVLILPIVFMIHDFEEVIFLVLPYNKYIFMKINEWKILERNNAVRGRAGLPYLPVGLSKTAFLEKIQDERLFELWGEDWRDDLIQWGKFIQRAIDNGSTTAEPYKVLLPLPRSVVTQRNGVIQQTRGITNFFIYPVKKKVLLRQGFLF